MPCTRPGSRSAVITVTPVGKLPITFRNNSVETPLIVIRKLH
jgi:hypothetical protein